MANRYAVLVCGGRDYQNRVHLERVLDTLSAEREITQIIQGGAPGADQLAANWANLCGITCLLVIADWARYGRSAGPLRNAEMLKRKPDLVVAFPGGAGTANMVNQARAAGVEVLEVEAE
jgi:YspA, cpYpsA-related SLOG family